MEQCQTLHLSDVGLACQASNVLLVMIVRLCLCVRLGCLHCVGAVVCAVGCSFLPFVVADEESAVVCTLVLIFFYIHVCIDY